ncbi:MAG: tetratricopeptide repeat protein [Gammaproteobacteria bacterium]
MASVDLARGEPVAKRISRRTREKWSPVEITATRNSARAGDVRSQCLLGAIYASGSGGRKDARVSFAWYEKAASSGDADGLFNTGVMLVLGEGVARDVQSGLNRLRKAARKGNWMAAETLGQYYEFGLSPDVKPNRRIAKHWYRLAANFGSLRAREALSQILRNI